MLTVLLQIFAKLLAQQAVFCCHCCNFGIRPTPILAKLKVVLYPILPRHVKGRVF